MLYIKYMHIYVEIVLLKYIVTDKLSKCWRSGAAFVKMKGCCDRKDVFAIKIGFGLPAETDFRIEKFTFNAKRSALPSI